MIKIIRKEDCVGCNACVQRCPKSCIEMHEDEHGFLYPLVDLNKCIDCHLCEKVCPVINQNEPKKPVNTYAAKNNDRNERLASSSGGLFFALARDVINNGGVVFGARFNDKWEVVHGYAEILEDVKSFRGAKYVQSRIGDSFSKVEKFLDSGRRVMFAGTPCQIAGLRLFLRRDYGRKLLIVDMVCHGVPSPLVWGEYMKSIVNGSCEPSCNTITLKSQNKKFGITEVSFRDKRLGWENFGFSVRASVPVGSGINKTFQVGVNNGLELLFERFDKNLFMLGFLNNMYLRPSCYDCPAKCGKSHSDITLADFWGISSHYPDLHDDSGVSLILVNTVTGNEVLSRLSIELHKVDYNLALAGNPSIERSAVNLEDTVLFWNLWAAHGLDSVRIILKKKQGSFLHRALRFVKRKLRNCLNL